MAQFAGMPIKLRNLGAKIISAESPAELESALTAFLDDGGERVLVAALEVAELTILILYAE